MNRREHVTQMSSLAAVASTGLWPPASSAAQSATAADALFGGLKPSARQPVLFLGHGSPMNALPGNPWYAEWEQLGQALLARGEPPQLILCISAHWITQGGWMVTGMAEPKTIHDFGGFPQALYDMQYPAPGAPAVAQALSERLFDPAHPGRHVGIDHDEWGLDHGSWAVLKPMFPEAQIPVVQLSIDYSRPLAEHYALGQQLSALRDKGVLIVASGNIVHNLRQMDRNAQSNQAYDWAIEFDAHVHSQLAKGDLQGLAEVQKLGSVMRMAHPTHDHYLPLLYAAGAVGHGDGKGKEPQFFNQGFQAGSISMQSVMWG